MSDREIPKTRRTKAGIRYSNLGQFRVTAVQDEPPPPRVLDSPESTVDAWKDLVVPMPWFDPEKEHMVVFVLNTRLGLKGWNVVSVGSNSETTCHPREVLAAGARRRRSRVHRRPQPPQRGSEPVACRPGCDQPPAGFGGAAPSPLHRSRRRRLRRPQLLVPRGRTDLIPHAPLGCVRDSGHLPGPYMCPHNANQEPKRRNHESDHQGTRDPLGGSPAGETTAGAPGTDDRVGNEQPTCGSAGASSSTGESRASFPT
jgi:hypothetical protein